MTGEMESAAEGLAYDLSAFANPRTPVEVQTVASGLLASWQEGRDQRQEMFELDRDDRLVWLPAETDGARPYRDFLRSSALADYEQLALATTRKYAIARNFVPPKAELEQGNANPESFDASLREVAALIGSALSARAGLTNIFFVKGDAGAGKTTLLQQLAAEQAHRYLAHDQIGDFLFLYVSAQGRLLSNLPDALAAETQDLGARFRNDAVPVLARRRALVPIIDGFDELIGTAGYSDAFSSLQGLLAQLDGQGVILVSARSSFYEAEFLASGRYFEESAYQVTPVSLLPWSSDKLHEYLRLTSDPARASAHIRLLDQLGAEDRELLRRPFFASAYPEYADERISEGTAAPILDQLIARYIDRESSKIVDANGNRLLPLDGHRRIFEEAAEHMWLNGDRRLSTDDLRTIALVVAEQEGLRAADAAQFETKITSYAGFTVGRADSFGFEHEIYFDFFLGQAAVRALGTGDLGSFLDRGLITTRVAATVSQSSRNVREVLDLVSTVGTKAPEHENRRRNLGLLVATLARRAGGLDSCTIRAADFVSLDLSDLAFTGVVFEDCAFVNVDLEGSTFEACTSTRTFLTGIRVDEGTQMGIEGLDPFESVTSVVHDNEELFIPAAIADLLRARGLPGHDRVEAAPSALLGPHASRVLRLLQRLARQFRRTTLIAPSDEGDGPEARLFSDPVWPVLRGLLLKHDLVREQTRPASGRRKDFLRPAVDFRKLVRREQSFADPPRDGIDAFWLDVRRLDRT